jgi:hypothetical protein
MIDQRLFVSLYDLKATPKTITELLDEISSVEDFADTVMEARRLRRLTEQKGETK